MELVAKIVILFASIAVSIWKPGQSGHMPSVINNGVLKTGKPFLCWLQPLVGCREDGSRQPTQRMLPPSETLSISASPCTCLACHPIIQRPQFQSLMEITLSKTFFHLLLLFRALYKKLPRWSLPWPAPCLYLHGCPSHSCLPGPSLTAL